MTYRIGRARQRGVPSLNRGRTNDPVSTPRFQGERGRGRVAIRMAIAVADQFLSVTCNLVALAATRNRRLQMAPKESLRAALSPSRFGSWPRTHTAAATR